MNIDFVIAWVDGNDPLWQKERNLYRADATTYIGRCLQTINPNANRLPGTCSCMQ